jgi:hypothetical protein
MITSYDDVMRTIIEVPAEQLEALAELCRRENISRAEAIRRAIAAHVGRARRDAAAPAFGLWRDRAIDGLAYERRFRQEWDAPPAAQAPGSRRRRRSR